MSYGTIHVDESIVINRPPAEVWTAIADYAVDLHWRAGLVEMSPSPPGPAALGTEVREVLRRAGRTYTATATVDQFDAGVGYHFSGQGTSGQLHGRREVVAGAAPGTTRFTYAVAIRPPLGLRLIAPLVTAMARSGMRRDLRRLKVLLEKQALAPQAATSASGAACP
jgi:hypothetical protein